MPFYKHMQSINKCIGEELKRFEQSFSEEMTSDTPLLNKVLSYLVKQKGKQMRAMFVLLCARLGGPINEKSYHAASFVEMLHTSSLVHDDLIDNSLERRGAYSVKALWKNRAAVYTGDYLFAKSILMLLCAGDYRLLKIFSAAAGKVIEGELLQMEKSRKLHADEAVYYNIIKGKTAHLLAACCAAGAASTFIEDAPVSQLYAFGEMLGMSFQIKDDLLDYSTEDIGKPTGNDLKEKKATLPLIYTLNNCNAALRKKLVKIFKTNDPDKSSTDFLKQAVAENGGIAYAEQKMQFFVDESLKLLYKFPESEARRALEELTIYAIGRSK